VQLFVARQPILDARLNVVAFELLFRSGQANIFDGSEENASTAQVINSAFYGPGGEDILRGKPAFLNFPRGLLVGDGGATLPPAQTVIEILETVEPDEEVVAACQRLRARGYRLALDDFVPAGGSNPLLSLIQYLKVDFRLTTRSQQAKVARRYGRDVQLLAEKVETEEEFRAASSMGYTLFQGYFFARPVILSRQEVPAFKLDYLRIMEELHRDELDFDQIAGLLRAQPALAYKLLRFVNSALFAIRQEIGSIQQAMTIIGEDELRRWLSVALLMGLTTDKPDEVMMNALARARFCELLAPQAGLESRRADLFLVGLFSRLDTLFGLPLEEVLGELNLREDMRRALLGTAKPGERLAALWDLVLRYEAAEWDAAAERAAGLGVTVERLREAYTSALSWSDEVWRG